jgi:ABC-2 type transport system ATP-binding protein
MSVKVSQLTKLYGEQKAVNNISFEINTGEIVGFLGPNGAGKSTTMKMLTCFIEPSSGTAQIGGNDIIEESMEVRKKVGYLPESNPLYFDMYVKEYLDFAAGVYKLANKKQRIDEMIEKTGLTREMRKKIGQLSKGYKQRVGLAQAMLHNPEVLILDEPTSGLDPNQLVEIRNLIKDLGKEKTVILSTHIMQEVEAMCSKVIIINKGNLVANDTVENIQKKRKSGQMVKFKTGTPLKENHIGGIQIEKFDNGFYRATYSGAGDLRAEIFNYCVKNNLTLLHLEEELYKMEDVFKELTK